MYSVILTFIFKIKHFLVKHLPLQKCAKTANVPDQFASTRASPSREIALVTDSCPDTRRTMIKKDKFVGEHIGMGELATL